MKRIATIVSTLLLGLGLFTTPTPAHASDAEPLARVERPLLPNNPKGTLVRVQIEGEGDDWGLRHFAETMDARFTGLRVRSHGTCSERPSWTCVQVTVASWNPEQQVEFAGITFMAATDNLWLNRRSVWLNSYYTPASSYAVAAHEFGHVLGLNHHQQGGVCGIVPDQTALSWAEDKVLRQFYGRKVSG